MGKYEILKQKPSAECNHTWGIYDHCLLNFVADKLEQNSESNFVLCLTSTSHTPFEFPKKYTLPDFELNDESMKKFVGDPKMVKEYLKGYQYSNRALGDFMDRIKSTPSLAENTIVVITGDHNIRMILPYEKMRGAALPKLGATLRLPAAQTARNYSSIPPAGVPIPDIIPTLAPLIFSNTRVCQHGTEPIRQQQKF